MPDSSTPDFSTPDHAESDRVDAAIGSRIPDDAEEPEVVAHSVATEELPWCIGNG
ncbi:MAG TPA: hypothetical protein VHW44_23265 [Pseudonocardiaceae bacterium]|jgi:hypothetical protein|nr:hypothetical protein [Pseudonocardiaceae bacterium]